MEYTGKRMSAYFVSVATLLMIFGSIIYTFVYIPKNRLYFLLNLIAIALWIRTTAIYGGWEYIGVSISILYVVLNSIGLIVNVYIFSKMRKEPKAGAILVIPIALICIFGVLNIGHFSSGLTPDKPIVLQFPMKAGKFYIMQGGYGFWMNPFHWQKPDEQYAVDIVELNNIGMRADGILPNHLRQYQIYLRSVYFPISGIVVRSMTNRFDRIPPDADSADRVGNFVVIRNADLEVTVAHLARNTIRITNGQLIRAGAYLGKVGNSGNSAEPHLHIQVATTNGHAVPFRFDNQNIFLNQIFER